VPFATPGLVWNAMMSMSGGWFFIVASEAITVSGEEVALPGIGSYIAAALAQERGDAVAWAVVAMVAVILIYDQVLLRPLVAWADRFKAESEPDAARPSSWVLTVLRRTRLLPAIAAAALRLVDRTPARRQAEAASTPRVGALDRVLPPIAVIAAALG